MTANGNTSPNPSGKGRRGEALAFWMLLLGALALFVWRWSAQASGLSAEQAESLLLARSWVDGLGLRLTAASSASPGPVNLFWLFVQGLVVRAGAAPEVWLPRASLVLLSLSLMAVALRGSLVWRRPIQVEDALPALGLSVATATAEAAALGSGSAAWVLALAVVAIVMGRGLSTGVSTSAALAIGALCLLRPAAIWLLVATTPAWWLAARLEGRPAAVREALRFLIGGAFVAGLVFLFRFLALGALPLQGVFPSDEGKVSTFAFLSRQSLWFWAALAGSLLAFVWRRFHLRGGGMVLAWVSMTVALAVWTPSARTLFLGCVPLLAMLLGDGLSASRLKMAEKERPLRVLAWLAFLGLTVMLGLAAASSYTLEPVMPVSTPIAPRPELREELARRGLRQPLVAWSDGVEAAVLFPEARIVEVKEPTPALEDLLVSEGPPDVLDLRIGVTGMPRLGASMKLGPGAWWLGEQSPDEDPRCPDGRLALLSVTPEQLLAQLEQDVEDEALSRALSRWRCALAAFETTHLPDPVARRSFAGMVDGRSKVFEQQGRMELAVRAASLAASVDGEDVQRRARAERLRERWLSAR